MKNYKIVSVLWGLCLLLLSPPAVAGMETVELASLRQRGRQLKSQAQTLKAQYNALKTKQKNLEQERARLARRAAEIKVRINQEMRDFKKILRKLDDIYEYPNWDVAEEAKYNLAFKMSMKLIKDLEADLKKVNDRRKEIQYDINDIVKDKQNIRIQYKQLQAEFNLVKSQYYNLKKRVANRKQQQRSRRIRGPTVGRKPPTQPPQSSKKSGHGFSIQY